MVFEARFYIAIKNFEMITLKLDWIIKRKCNDRKKNACWNGLFNWVNQFTLIQFPVAYMLENIFIRSLISAQIHIYNIKWNDKWHPPLPYATVSIFAPESSWSHWDRDGVLRIVHITIRPKATHIKIIGLF